MTTIYPPELSTAPFMLGRHGESIFNKDKTLSQGRGEDEPGNPNGLTDEGREQMQAAPAVFAAAGMIVRRVTSSELRRAGESALCFAIASDDPELLLLRPIPGIKEVSQLGWERKRSREEVADLRKASVQRTTAALLHLGLKEELADYVPWVTRFGRGDTPLEAALRGIVSVQIHQPQPGDLIIGHAMLNRYMDAVATTTTAGDRQELHDTGADRSRFADVRTINAMHDLHIPGFAIANDSSNRQANGSAIAYTVNPETGQWIAGQRIEAPKGPDGPAYLAYARTPEGIWEKL